jgi:hypothetical protein
VTDLDTYADVIDRVLAGMEDVRYRRPTPKLPRPRRTVRVALAVGAVMAIVLISTQVQAPSGPPTQTQASPKTTPVVWASVPQVATEADAQSATEACGKGLETLDPSLDIRLEELPPLVILDIRGNRALATFFDGDRYVLCEVETAVRPWAGTIRESVAGLRTEGPDGLRMVSFGAWGEGDGAINYTIGLAGPSVAKVVIDFGLSGLRTGEATLSDGAFSIWWPGAYSAGTLRTLEADGGEVRAVTFWIIEARGSIAICSLIGPTSPPAGVPRPCRDL